ncbi:MAG: hypothetical protein Q4G71_01060 [Pseudomonadota bacterium]|nr:hypothetical protein [Pseudomonadota bacterium]
MRTTLDIDVAVLDATKELARARGLTAGEMVSQLLRQALLQGTAEGAAPGGLRNGFAVLPQAPERRVTTDERVNRLRDEEGV